MCCTLCYVFHIRLFTVIMQHCCYFHRVDGNGGPHRSEELLLFPTASPSSELASQSLVCLTSTSFSLQSSLLPSWLPPHPGDLGGAEMVLLPWKKRTESTQQSLMNGSPRSLRGNFVGVPTPGCRNSSLHLPSGRFPFLLSSFPGTLKAAIGYALLQLFSLFFFLLRNGD